MDILSASHALCREWAISIHGIDHIGDLVCPHAVKDRQAQHLIGVLLRARKTAMRVPEICIALCEMRRDGIVDHRLNAMCMEIRLEVIA